MKTMSGDGRVARLRADISISTRVTRPGLVIWAAKILKPVMPHGTALPAEATYRFANATVRSSTIELSFFFGDNHLDSRDVPLGQFLVEGIPHAPMGPSEIELKISADAEQLLCCSVRDPLVEGYRSVAFIDLRKVEPPPAIPPSEPWALVKDMADPEKLMSQLFHPARKRPSRPGGDISHSLSLTFDEALHGAQKPIEVLGAVECPVCAGRGMQPGTGPQACPDCKGVGSVRTERSTEFGHSVTQSTCRTCEGTGEVTTSPCTTCQGEGMVRSRRPFTADIPPGIDSGARICYPHEGEPGKYGGRPGHLYVEVAVKGDPLFTRLGRSVSIRLPVSVEFARAGGQLRVPDVTEGGFFLLELPPDTRDGAKFRVYGDELYTLDAVIETYHPYNPAAVIKYRKRLREIKAALQGREYQAQV